MELLDQLERRIGALLSRVETLAVENAALKTGREQELFSLQEENRALRQELELERSKNSNALTRIEALVERLREQADQE
jgi:FtsZ-binding cell division protein ZapB